MYSPLLIFSLVYIAMIATSFWESYVEGRNPWNRRKVGWILKIGKFTLPGYHFFLFLVMYPVLLSLPLVINGWNSRLFGILFSAYTTGLIIEDFVWFVVNPEVRLYEFWTSFSDYYPWIKIRGQKIIPLGYVVGVMAAFLSWYFLWK